MPQGLLDTGQSIAVNCRACCIKSDCLLLFCLVAGSDCFHPLPSWFSTTWLGSLTSLAQCLNVASAGQPNRVLRRPLRPRLPPALLRNIGCARGRLVRAFCLSSLLCSVVLVVCSAFCLCLCVALGSWIPWLALFLSPSSARLPWLTHSCRFRARSNLRPYLPYLPYLSSHLFSTPHRYCSSSCREKGPGLNDMRHRFANQNQREKEEQGIQVRVWFWSFFVLSWSCGQRLNQGSVLWSASTVLVLCLFIG